MDKRKKIQMYLTDNEQLYKEWYKKQMEHITGIKYGEPIGAFDDYREAFQNWLEDNKLTIKKAICPHLNKINKIKEKVDIVLAIIALIEGLNLAGSVVEASSLIFLYGLDKLCADNVA